MREDLGFTNTQELDPITHEPITEKRHEELDPFAKLRQLPQASNLTEKAKIAKDTLSANKLAEDIESAASAGIFGLQLSENVPDKAKEILKQKGYTVVDRCGSTNPAIYWLPKSKE